jgi:hypothetical protein
VGRGREEGAPAASASEPAPTATFSLKNVGNFPGRVASDVRCKRYALALVVVTLQAMRYPERPMGPASLIRSLISQGLSADRTQVSDLGSGSSGAEVGGEM